MSWLPIIAVETILASAVTAVLYWWDKRVAQSGTRFRGNAKNRGFSASQTASGAQRASKSAGLSKGPSRIPERTLLIASLLGGWPGGWWASRQFRHKTQKRSYRIQFVLVCILHIVAVLCILRFG